MDIGILADSVNKIDVGTLVDSLSLNERVVLACVFMIGSATILSTATYGICKLLERYNSRNSDKYIRQYNPKSSK